MFLENIYFFHIMGKNSQTSNFSPPLTPTRIDWYIFHSSLIPSSIFRKRLVEWAISSSFHLFFNLIPPNQYCKFVFSGDLMWREKCEVPIYIYTHCYMLSQKYVLFWCGTYMFHENLNILFLIMGKKFLKVENCLCFGIELINICFISSDSPHPYSAKDE